MRFFLHAAGWGCLGLCALGVCCGAVAAQEAEDRAAFRAARATADPAERLAALLQFSESYPESALRPRATELALDTALRRVSAETEEGKQGQGVQLIHTLAAQEIADAPEGLERWIEEARVADALAAAPPAGADLPDAHRWAEAALSALTEESFRRETAAAQRRYGLPPLTPREVHRDFLRNRVLFLTAMADVDLRQGKREVAEPLLDAAYRLDPLASEVNLLRGQTELAGHEDAAALESLERARVAGAVPEPWQAEMLRLYTKSGGTGDAAGLEGQLDTLYARLYPAGFTLPPRSVPAGGHTALLELFTGAGCEPCVAPDLAVESLLTSYRRRDLAVLEYDENIPRPDPLTNPASEARAAEYRVGNTPQAFLDGEELPVAGSNRGDVENVVVGFADELENEAAQPSPLRLTVGATSSAGVVAVYGEVSLATKAGSAASLPGRPVVHVALVQDHIRYSGENGVRFHRMVVRALSPETTLHLSAAAATPSGTPGQTVEARFDLGKVQGELNAYLNAYERGNDRFGQVQFVTKDLPLDPAQLGVVVWVQDAATHAVLQSAYAAVPAASPAASPAAGGVIR